MAKTNVPKTPEPKPVLTDPAKPVVIPPHPSDGKVPRK